MPFPYTVIRSRRKTIAIQVRQDGSVVLRIPAACPVGTAEQFLREKQDWVLRKEDRRKNIGKTEGLRVFFRSGSRRKNGKRQNGILPFRRNGTPDASASPTEGSPYGIRKQGGEAAARREISISTGD